MISVNELKTWLHTDTSRLDKLLLILASLESACQVGEVRERANEAGLRIPKSWNVSRILGRSNGLAIRTPRGWEITEAGLQHVRQLNDFGISVGEREVALGLRTELARISSSDTRAFVEEAVNCYEAHLYRSAIVMSWLAAVDVLKKHVLANHLSAFNTEAKRVDPKWRNAKTTDDLARMKEADFLDRIVALSVIRKNVKTELKECLERRNGCGHPNSLKIGANTVTHHIEILLLNVFKPFLV